MSTVTSHLSISLDGYVAGPDQTLDDPLGTGGEDLHTWMFGDVAPTDADLLARTFDGIGAYVMGRKMFGPDQGWWDESWTGWWGEDPPYHVPVFVLAHREREPVRMKGGTTFVFVSDGIESALAQARAAAGGKRVDIAGGASTVRQYLAAGLLDELTLHIAPVLLGAGERLLDGVGDVALEQVEVIASPAVTHLRYRITR